MEVLFMQKNIQLSEQIFNVLSDFINENKIQEAKLAIADLALRILDDNKSTGPKTNEEALSLFIDAKRIEGCSEKSLNYYRTTLVPILKEINKDYFLINTEDLRGFLSNYKNKNDVSKTTIDNIRRIISTFFS